MCHVTVPCFFLCRRVKIILMMMLIFVLLFLDSKLAGLDNSSIASSSSNVNKRSESVRSPVLWATRRRVARKSLYGIP